MEQRHPLLSILALAAVLCTSTQASAQVSADGLLAVPESIKRLATQDAQEQRARWGDLAAAEGKTWLSAAPGEAARVANVWRIAQWIVPGAAMRYQRGFCVAMRCTATDYAVHYNPETKQLDFFDKGEKVYTSRIAEDGSLRLVGTGLVGVLTAETLKLDTASGILHSDKHELRPATAAQLADATGGFTGSVAAHAPAAPASADEQARIRAEMAAMKAQIDALQKRLQAAPAAGVAAPAGAPTPALTPAEQKAVQQREALEARLHDARQRKQQAERRKLEVDQNAQAQAQDRIDAARKGKEAAEARVAEAQRAFEAGGTKPAEAPAAPPRMRPAR